jgi:putative molybdopterin biosynthesis protein
MPLHGADVEASFDAWIEALVAAGAPRQLEAETVGLELAAGRVTAEPIFASRSAPAFDAAAMDGIAVAARATANAPVTLGSEEYFTVDTGDPMPPGTDAVVRREDVVVAAGATVEREVEPFTHVRQVGEDVAAGDLVFPAGRLLRPADVAVLGSVGETSVSVTRRPVVAILPSGDELVPLGAEPGADGIIETNSLLLAAMVEEAGGVAVRLPIVADEPALLEAGLEQAAADADLVLLVAGSAKGRGDHAVIVISSAGEVVVQGVAIRPGHPVVLGLAGATPVIGVPGYPVSAALAFELFGVRLLATLGDRQLGRRPRVQALAMLEMPSSSSSEEWVRARIGLVDGNLVAIPLRRGAGVLSSLARADGLVRVPQGTARVGPGEHVEVELLRPLDAIEATLLVTGSTDPLLDDLAPLVCQGLRESGPRLSVDTDGSANGAAALAAGRCHLALVEERDIPTGAITLARWERTLGLMLAPGNPLEIDGIDELGRPGIRVTNRQPGSSSRRLLDDALIEHALDPRALTGYRREARSHAAAAAAVAAGTTDCAVGVLAATFRHTLDFVGLATQKLALVAAPDLAGDGRISILGKRLAAEQCRDEAERRGYRVLERQ